MKHCALLLTLLLLVSVRANAQDAAYDLTLQHLLANPAKYHLIDADLSDVAVTSAYTDDATGVRHLYLVQRHAGIEVFNGIVNAHVRDGEVLHVGNKFVSKLSGRLNTTAPSLSAAAAVEAAAQDRGLTLSAPLTVQEAAGGPDQQVTFSKAGISLEPIPAKLVFQPLEDGSVRLAWQVEIYQLDQEHYWNMRIDAVTGAVLARDDLVVKDNFGYDNFVTDNPDWRTNPAMREHLIAKYEAEKAHAGHGAHAEHSASAPTSDGRYEVYALPHESPSHAGEPNLLGPATRRTQVSESAAADALASPLGWHDDGTATYTTTRGNNVWSYLDNGGTEVGPSPNDGTSRNFTTSNPSPLVNYNIDFGQNPVFYRDGAVVNLFYMNNMMHDLFYRYGFDERSGNMQQTNMGRGGAGRDAVLAQAQDGGGTNNANMLTLPDGEPTRMQMYLWTPGIMEKLVHVASPSQVARSYDAREAGFGRPLDETALTAKIVLAQAGPNHIGAPEEGCSANASLPAGAVPLPFANAAQIAGNYALVKRGSCNFIDKALNAQASGAIGVIVYNNIPAEPISMGATGGQVVQVPVVMIHQADGLAFRAVLDAGGTVTGAMRRDGGRLPLRDGDLDNGIIAHEYMHSISSRLAGGPSRVCLGGNEQGGEGWSDWAALMLTMRNGHSRGTPRSIASYSLYRDPASGEGLRPRPYSTDMGVNDYTYGDIFNPEISVPHGVGFIWATALWEVVWNLVDQYGFDPNLYAGQGGNNKAMRLVTEGLRLTPCNPTFIDMRDALLAADRVLNPLNDPTDPRKSVNECHIWEGMARRGVGVHAIAGGAEDFTLPLSCQPRLTLSKTADKPLTVAGDVVTFSTTVTNETLVPASGVVVTDPIPANSQLIAGSVSTGAGCSGTVSNGVATFNVGNLAPGGSNTCSYQVRIDGSVYSSTLFIDDMESGSTNWKTDAQPPTWVYQPASPNAHSGVAAWFAHDFATDANQRLTLAQPIRLPAPSATSTGTPGLLFWHAYDTEESFDGGFVEISTNGGAAWFDLGSRMSANGYNGGFFHGNSNGYIQTRVDLSDYAGKDVLVRFRMFTDMLVPGVGWFVDDVEFLDQGCVYSTATAKASELPLEVSALARSCVTNTAPIAVDVAARLFLEGAYDAATGQMHAGLNAAGHLPRSQPFANAAFDGTAMDYDGAEQVAEGFFAAHADIVDWVLVELRSSSAPSSRVARQAAFVKRDGSVVALDGTSPLRITVPAVQAYHVVVRHRNHLPVLSNGAVSPSGNTLTVDFTTGQAAGTEPMKPLGLAGPYGLYAGDADGSGTVDQLDQSNRWSTEAGTSGYKSADYNVDGQVQVSDKNTYWKPNRGRTTQVDGTSL